MPKRKLDSSDTQDLVDDADTQISCIVHSPEFSDPGKFTSFSVIRGDPSEKLKQLLDIRDKRQGQPFCSPYRFDSICDQIPSDLPDDLETVGYHRLCYQKFTKNLDRLSDACASEASTSDRHHSPRKSTSVGATLFPPECIFCEKVTKQSGRRTERTQVFSSWKNKENAWEKIEARAQQMGNDRLYRTVKGQDLFAVEAMHHPSCLRSFHTAFYNFERSQHNSSNVGEDSEHSKMTSAHNNAFECVLEYIRDHIVDKKDVIPLSSLRNLYVQQLKENGYENDGYRSEKLLKRLRNDPINSHLGYVKMTEEARDMISFWLIHSSDITVADAIRQAYLLRNTDRYLDSALNMRSSILKAFKESKPIPWPPAPDELDISSEDIVPEQLTRFLSILLQAKEISETNENVKRLIFSIGQDLCRAVTEGEWLLPKHVLLCSTVRHLYRSKQLTTILYRLGHCESYPFALEMEAAHAQALDESSTHLTTQIVTGEGNRVFHCEWDNLNKILTNLHGSNFVNSAGGIMIQEIQPDACSSGTRKLPVLDRSEHRSRTAVTPETIPPLHIKRTGPPFDSQMSFSPPPEHDEVYQTGMKKYYLWLFSRSIGSSGTQPVSMLGGFISVTGSTPAMKSTVEYFMPIHQPITENAVVRELLKRSEEATAEVGQDYVLNTDILFILLAHVHSVPLTVYLDTGCGKSRQLVNVTDLANSLSPEYCSSLLGLYVFTGEDCTSAFKGKGKVAPLKKLEKNPRFQESFRELGENWSVDMDTCKALEQFTCVMYGHSRETSINSVRAKMLRGMVGENHELTSKSKVDLSRLPPCRSALIPHIQRVNHRVALYKRAHQPVFPRLPPYSPEQGWVKTEYGVLEPLWSITPILPPSLIDLLESGATEYDSDEEDNYMYTDDLSDSEDE